MKWEHLKAILWLRWRLGFNQWKRHGRISAAIFVVAVVAALFFSVVSLFAAIGIGVLTLGEADPDILMFIWDGLIVAFLFFWMIGILTDLQRSDSLSLDKLLHLPISPSGTFLLNYLTSLVTIPTLVFLPLMFGLCVALVIVQGPAMLLMFPLLIGFVLMITALTYQFRGWLATLMVNKRRRRTIIGLMTFGFILLTQTPNLLNMFVWQHDRDESRAQRQEHEQRLQELRDQRDSGEITAQEFLDKDQALHASWIEAGEQREEDQYRQIIDTAVLVNLAIPAGWPAYGSRALAQGVVLPGLLCAAGLFAAGSISLRRSYRTTIRYFTGGFDSPGRRPRRKAAADIAPLDTAAVPAGATRSVRLLERSLGPISEHATAIALANFRSLLRAPEAKMILLTPIIMLVVFGSMLFSGGGRNMPEFWRPLVGIGAIGMPMFGLLHIMQNQFGFDRTGFRVYVLSPAPRRDILLGKNLAVAPLGIAMCVVSLAALQIALPMRVDQLLATFLQIGTVLMVLCMVGNLASIQAPVAIKAGSMSAAHTSLLTALLQFIFAMIFPAALLPTFLCVGADLLLDHLGWRFGVPVYLILSCIQLGVAYWIYRNVLSLEGRLLERRERKILDTVATGAQ